MMKRQLILVLRNFFRRKLISFTIVFSVGIALSIATLLYSFIQRELATDKFHASYGSVFRLLSNDPFVDTGKTMSFILQDASEYVSANYPDVKRVCRMNELSRGGVPLSDGTTTYENIMVVAADTSFWRMFNFPLSKTTHHEGDPDGITITEKLRSTIFGDADPLGKTLTVRYDTMVFNFTVTGIFEKSIENTHFKFDALVPFELFRKKIPGSSTYVQLFDKASSETVEKKLSDDPQMPSLVGPGKCDYFLQSLPDVHFDKDNVKIFTQARSKDFIDALWLIIVFILFIGAFNFLNLFMISLGERRKEFGIRKIQGATLINLRMSIVVETLFYVFTGWMISIAVSLLCLPLMNQVFVSDMDAGYLFRPGIMAAVAILFASLVVIVSFVLTFYLHRLQPASLLKQAQLPRVIFDKGFLTIQFMISLALIVCAVGIIKQVQFIKEKPLGFDRNIIEIKLPTGGRPADLLSLKSSLEQHTMFRSVSLSSGNPVSGNQQIRFDLNDKEFYSPYFMKGDEKLTTTLGLRLIDGSVPSASSHNDKVVNETFVKYFNIKDPIGAPIPGGKGEKIIGVVSDFNVSSLRQEIPLYMIGYDSAPSKLLINYAGTDPYEAKREVEAQWNKIFKSSPFTYSFLGDQLLLKHKDDLQFSEVIIAFSLASIIISCFGLFALALSSCQKKGKEIAIRKSLGASSSSVIFLLLIDFGKWVILSFVLGSVIGYFVVQRWMQTFIYRIEIGWQIFALSFIIGAAFFLFAVMSQTLRAANENPTKGLRYE